jgi:hypothetical protein
LSGVDLVPYHTRVLKSNSAIYVYDNTNTTADDGDIYIEPTNGNGCFVKQRNITHTGEITGKTLVTVASNDNLLITDTSDSNNLKKIVASDLIDLVNDTSPDLGGNLNVNSYSIVDTNSNELLKFGITASAVNEVTVTNNSTTNNPKISATGDDTNIGLTIEGKGTGVITFNSPVYITEALTVAGAININNVQVLTTQQPAIDSLSDSTGGTIDTTLFNVSGSGADTTINDNFASLNAQLEAILLAMRTHGLILTGGGGGS